MLMILAVVLVVAWLLGWGAFHVAGGLIHILLIVAVISIVLHFVRGRGATGYTPKAGNVGSEHQILSPIRPATSVSCTC
jgi:hypothetical protein